MRLLTSWDSKETIFEVCFHTELEGRAKASLVDNVLKHRELSVVFVRSAENLTNLGKSEAVGGCSLEEKGGDFHVAETFRAEVESLFQKFDVFIDINLRDEVAGILREAFIGLGEAEPS